MKSPWVARFRANLQQYISQYRLHDVDVGAVGANNVILSPFKRIRPVIRVKRCQRRQTKLLTKLSAGFSTIDINLCSLI